MARRRILFVAPEVPSPPTYGFALRVHHLARHLAESHDVALLAFGEPGSVTEVPGVFGTVTLVAPPGGMKRLDQLGSLATRSSYHLRWRRSPAMQAALDRAVATWAPDIVQIESSIMGWLRVPAGPVVVLDEHNIESELLRRIARTETTALRSLFGRIEELKVHREELLNWERADGVTLTSVRDEVALERRLPDAWTCVVPNGVDLEAWHPDPATEVEPESIVYVGSINYRPNTDAVLHMVHDILPLVDRLRPGVTLTVVGQGTPEALARLAGPRVRFVGAVPDARPYVARAAAVVVPLRVGGGTRLKVLEALAMGKAVVSSRIGCEGIEVVDGEHLLVADLPERFAERLVEVLDGAGLRASLGRAGRALVAERYGWRDVASRLNEFHATLQARTIGVTG